METTTFVSGSGLDNIHDNVLMGKVDKPGGMSPDRTVKVLTKAANVDIYDSTEIRRRGGRTQRIAGSNLHSGWTNPFTNEAYYVEGSTLKKATYSGGTYSGTTVTTLQNAHRLSYCPINGEVAISNGNDLGWLSGASYEAFSQTLGQFELAMPAGQYLAYLAREGVLWVAKDNILYRSKPYNVMVRDERYSEFPMDGYIRMLAAVEDGLWVATEKHVGFISLTGQDEYSYVHKNNFVPADGAFGTWYDNEEKETPLTVYWASHMGLCLGKAGGAYQNLSEDKVKMPKAETGFAMLKAYNGIYQYVAVLRNNEDGNIFVAESQDVNTIEQ